MVIDNRLSSSRRIQPLSTEQGTYPNKPRLSILLACVKYSQRVGKVRPSVAQVFHETKFERDESYELTAFLYFFLLYIYI